MEVYIFSIALVQVCNTAWEFHGVLEGSKFTVFQSDRTPLSERVGLLYRVIPHSNEINNTSVKLK